jgi:hypothetical protein
MINKHYNSINPMGTTNQKQDHLIPDRGYKIISI